MKTDVKNCTFDTETDTEVGRLMCGTTGDGSDYEEILYKTCKGQYYLCGRGGETSKYPTPVFRVMKKTEALYWLDSLDEAPYLASVYINGNEVEKCLL